MQAQPEQMYLIGGPTNKHDPNWLIENKIKLTQDTVNLHIFSFKGFLAYNWRGDEPGNIKFLTSDNWGGSYHPDSETNLLLQGTTPMRIDGSDTKWFIADDRSADGYYELSLNTLDMTLTVDSFRHDLYPEKIFAVGSALPCGWNCNEPEPMLRINPTVPVYQWSGLLLNGDFKFLTPLSIGNWDFCYDALIENDTIIHNQFMPLVHEVRNSASTTFNDYKFIYNDSAECTITVNLTNNTIKIIKNNEIYLHDIWITGTAIPGGTAKLTIDSIDNTFNYNYNGSLLTGEFKFSTTQNAEPTTKYYIPSTTTGAIASGTLVNHTFNSNSSGWSVNNNYNLFNIKLNAMVNKYHGNVFNVEHVYIIGGATTAGWNTANAIELTRGQGSDSTIFTFDGNLTVSPTGNDTDKFKFLLQKNNGPFSLHPKTDNELVTVSEFFTTNNTNDCKWTIDHQKQGRYVIKLDVLQQTINTTFYPTNSIFTPQLTNVQVNSTSGLININNKTKSVVNVTVFTVDGKKITTKNVIDKMQTTVNTGIYIIQISNGHEFLTKKLYVK